MKKKYSMRCLVFAVLVMASAFSSCSKNEEDIAAPSITFIHPLENDTVQLQSGFISLVVMAQDNVNLRDMEMNLKDKSGTVLYSYDQDNIENTAYTCDEKFYPSGITKVTEMKLSVMFSNEFKNWTSKTITFYVKP